LFLSKEKLVTQRISGGLRPLVVGYDDRQLYAFNSTNVIVCKDRDGVSIKYLLALLNSKTLNWYYVTKFTNRSVLTVNISKTFLEQLPIKSPTAKQHKKIVDAVDEILGLTSNSKYVNDARTQVVVRDCENKIDDLIYRLYGLTDQERATIEAGTETKLMLSGKK